MIATKLNSNNLIPSAANRILCTCSLHNTVPAPPVNAYKNARLIEGWPRAVLELSMIFCTFFRTSEHELGYCRQLAP